MKKTHLLLMLLGCLLPLAALVALTVFKVPIGTAATFALFLLCPLSHLFLMKGLGHKTEKVAATTQTGEDNTRRSCH